MAACLGGIPLRTEKPPLPAFVDTFGWCTWDAFYEAVSPERVIQGLASWQETGITPRFLILDDGWQETVTAKTGERRLAGLGTNDKFPGGLAPLIDRAKGEFGIRTFLVWHALIGAWGGVDGNRLPAYQVRDIGRRFAPGLYRDFPDLDDWWGHLVGVVPPASIPAFYRDYHANLRSMGLDDIKVDSQAVLAAVSPALAGGCRWRPLTARRWKHPHKRASPAA